MADNISDDKIDIFCTDVLSANFPLAINLTFGISYAFLSAITIFSNAILIYALYKTRQLDNISNKLTVVMNLSDLCLGATIFPITAIKYLQHNSPRNCPLEKALTYIALFFVFLSVFMLCCISVDRYFRVMKMNRYNLYMNNFRMKVMIFLSVIAANFTSLATVLSPSFTQQVIAVLQGVPENLCPVCLKTTTKQQKVVTIFWHDVARKMLN